MSDHSTSLSPKLFVPPASMDRVGSKPPLRPQAETFLSSLTTAAASTKAQAVLKFAHANPLVVEKNTDVTWHDKAILVLIEGCSCSYRISQKGQRQIVRVNAPGDICNPWALYTDDLDTQLVATSPSRFIVLPIDRLVATEEDQGIHAILEASLAREYLAMIEMILVLGRCRARERLAYFILDLVDRLQCSEPTLEDSFVLGMTQADIADALGLTTIHTNRALGDLKADGIIRIKGKSYTIVKRAALEQILSFDMKSPSKSKYS